MNSERTDEFLVQPDQDRDAEPIRDFRELKKDQKIGAMVSSVANMVLIKAGKTTSPYAFQTDLVADLAKGELYGAAVSMATMSYHTLNTRHCHASASCRLTVSSSPIARWLAKRTRRGFEDVSHENTRVADV